MSRTRQSNVSYLLILDKDIYNFEADFTSLKLQPFYASEEEPT
jgi:hypothetical protein